MADDVAKRGDIASSASGVVITNYHHVPPSSPGSDWFWPLKIYNTLDAGLLALVFQCWDGPLESLLLRVSTAGSHLAVHLHSELLCCLAKEVLISRSTHTRAAKPASRVFPDLTVPKPERSWGQGCNMMVVCVDSSRCTELYSLRSKDETEELFTKDIAEISPRNVEIE